MTNRPELFGLSKKRSLKTGYEGWWKSEKLFLLNNSGLPAFLFLTNFFDQINSDRYFSSSQKTNMIFFE